VSPSSVTDSEDILQATSLLLISTSAEAPFCKEPDGTIDEESLLFGGGTLDLLCFCPRFCAETFFEVGAIVFIVVADAAVNGELWAAEILRLIDSSTSSFCTRGSLRW
jgi:hypothetical protein